MYSLIMNIHAAFSIGGKETIEYQKFTLRRKLKNWSQSYEVYIQVEKRKIIV